jgi:uncharacterized protein YdhG (YjbR/CyaY superfamily)
MDTAKPVTIDQYIATFTEDAQKALQQVRKAIQQAAPDAVETISYNMPTFKLYNKYLVHFAGYKKHIGFYALAPDTSPFKEEFSKYTTGKASVQFPLSEPMPLDLIKRIITYRIEEMQK